MADEICGVVNGDFRCSRPRGHSGDHVTQEDGKGSVGWTNEQETTLWRLNRLEERFEDLRAEVRWLRRQIPRPIR